MILEHERVEPIRQQRALHINLPANAQETQMDPVVRGGIATVVELRGRFVMEASVLVEPQARRLRLCLPSQSCWSSALLCHILDLDARVANPQVLTAEHEAVYTEANFGRKT